jgi:hypothetical protein
METKKHKCDSCSKEYINYKSLWKHKKTKHNSNTEIIQLDVAGFTCKYCNKYFTYRNNKWRHEKICKSNKEATVINNNTVNNNNANVINNADTINDVKIIINNYGNDNIDYISDTFKMNMLKSIFNNKDTVPRNINFPIPRIIENIKFNPNHKENNNLRITSKRSDVGYKYSDNKWLTVDKDELLCDLIKLGSEMFMNFYNENHKELTEEMKSCFTNFNKAIKQTGFNKEIKDKIHQIAYVYTKNTEDELDK